MGYDNWYFYAAALLIAETIFLAASFFDPELSMLRRRHPIAWQVAVLMISAVALYGSDSNKPEPPEPPPEHHDVRPVVWVVRTEDGGYRAFQIRVNADGSKTNLVEVEKNDR